MATILYIHGFLSSPQSHKARITKRWLEHHHPDIGFCCPPLSSYPSQARASLYQTIANCPDKEIFAVGSSLGGFWATHLLEHQMIKRAVLVNPGVMPQGRFHEFIGKPLKNYYTEDVYELSRQDLDDLAAFDVNPITQHQYYWLMVQKGDQTLDYRLALEKYRGCRQLVEEGGSHTFEGYENWLPDILAFFRA